MDASKKQREPVAFKSLAELKRFIRPGVEFKTVSHANHADMVGLTRVVTTVQTVGFYSKIKDQPEHPFSTCNHGKGFYTDFGKAGNYIFDGTTVKVKDSRKQDCGVIYELEFYDREQNMEETMMDRKMVNFIREQYPPGTRIRLNSMDDPYAPILPGTEGEVDFVDDKGQIFMKWDNGRTLPLAPGEDSFTVLPPTLTTLKLYMPLTADLYERNEYGEFDDCSTLLEGSELRGYQDQITAALAGACLGFLPRNFNPAEIFMGDTGSTFLGFVLAVTSILGVFKGYALLALIVSVLCVGLPVFDTICAMLRRMAKNQPIMQADRGHLHHKLIDHGFSQRQAVLIMYTISLLLGLLAIFISFKDSGTIVVMALTVIVLCFIIYYFNAHIRNKQDHDDK